MSLTRTLTAAALACCMAAPGIAQAGEVTLNFYHSYASTAEFLKPIVADFMKDHPNIKIKLQVPAESYSAANQTVIRGIMTDSLPDVYLPSYSTIKPLIETLKQNGHDVDFSGMLTSEGKDWVDANYSAKLLQLGQVGGKQYAMPFTASLPMLYVNQDLVTKAGGDMNNFPTTWDGVIALAQKINALNAGASGLSFSVGGLSDDWYWQMMVLSTGSGILNKDNTGIAYDNAQGLAALKATQDMAVKTNMTVNTTPEPASQAFFAGKVGMIVGSPSSLTNYTKSVGDRFTLRTEKFPMINPKEGGLPAGGNALVILTKDKDKQAAAWEFIKYLTGPKAQAEVSQATGYMPTNKKSEDVLKDFYAKHPNFQTVFAEMDWAAPWYSYPNNTADDIWKGVAQTLDKLQRNQITPEAALPEIRDHVAKVLAANK